MASGIFAVLDDIAALMDDVAVASKVATQKTAGILGDDLAVNAEKATGFLSSRELPVLWKITKGSLLNKVIIIPVVFLLNVVWPLAIKIILVLGGIYLAYEGVEKIIEWLFHRAKKGQEVIEDAQDANSEEEERTKVKSAISTDFILSLEIVIIALASVLNKPLEVQIITVCIVGLLATVGVYGFVALIVRMDDAGFKLIKRSNDKGFVAGLGHLLVKALPVIVKLFSIVGTIALLMVSGGIFTHSIEALHHLLTGIPTVLRDMLLALVVGLLTVLLVSGVQKIIAVIRK